MDFKEEAEYGDTAMESKEQTEEDVLGFRIMRNLPVKPSVGPGTYSPRYNQVRTEQPTISFSRQHRFMSAKAGYISGHHNSDLLCSASPGPKYQIKDNNPTQNKAPAYSWGGDRETLELRRKNASFLSGGEADVGPAAYTPRQLLTKPRSPRAPFAKSERFLNNPPFVSHNHALTNVGIGKPGPDQYSPRLETVQHKAPGYSFGLKHPDKDRWNLKTDRATFLTHSIRGGLAKPATLECNIGPGDYTPRSHVIEDQRMRTVFSKSARFQKPGLQFISRQHCMSQVGNGSPGPKYFYNRQDTARQTQNTPRTSSLKWIP